jgi:DivIVA domain-containing protein
VTIVVLLVVVAVVGGVIVVMAGRFGGEGEFVPDRPYFALPEEPLDASTVDGVRFAVGMRGYRMDQVDAVMDRLALELSDRDRQLAELRGEPFGEPAPVEAAEVADDAARD